MIRERIVENAGWAQSLDKQKKDVLTNKSLVNATFSAYRSFLFYRETLNSETTLL